MTPGDTRYTFGFLHVKAVDDAGHDKNRGLKVRARASLVIPLNLSIRSSFYIELTQ